MNDTDKLTVLKLLANGRNLEFTAAATAMPIGYVQSIADRHGWPDTSALRAAADAISIEIAAPRIPERKPEPPHPVALAPHPVAAVPDETPPGQLLRVPIAKLQPDPENPRTDLGDIRGLADSLTAAGMIQPIVCRRTRTGQLIIVAGHRRWEAAKHAGWRTVPVVVRARDMKPDEVLAAMLVENGQREDLDPIEEARALRRLLSNTTMGELGARIGRPASYIARRIELLSLPVEEQDELRRGQMTLTEASQRAKLAAGKVPTGITRGMPHLSAAHPLADRAKARCKRLAHSRGKGQGVGGVACGACWESVIRADERDHLHESSARRGECGICGGSYAQPLDDTRSASA